MPILTVTLNPAVDLATDCATLVPNEKLRCSTATLDPGGGGVNVSRAIAILGGTSQPFVALGGTTGDQFLDLLAGEGLEPAVFEINGETRQSIAVTARDTNHQFRFVLPGPRWSDEQGVEAVDHIREHSTAGGCVVLSGSVPGGLDASYTASIARDLANEGRRLIIDTSGPALAALIQHASESRGKRPCCIRMNRHEAESLGTELESAEAIRLLGRRLLNQGIAEIIALSDGAKGSYFFDREDDYFVPAPTVERRSAIGAGDSFVAALTLGLHRGWDLLKTGRYAVSAASAALTTPATDLCSRETAEELFAALEGN